MRITRFYQNTPLNIDATIQLTDEVANHATCVLRLPLGASLILFNGTGGEYEAVITEIKKNFVSATIKKFIDRTAESPLKIHLGQAIARGEKMDLIIQKAVELGVHEITPLFSDHCNVQLQGERLTKKIQHWQAVAISACEQSGRNIIPTVHIAQTTYAWMSQCNAPLKLLLDPTAYVALHQLSQSIQQTALLIGPEGGLSSQEITAAEQQQFQTIHLGPRILRTETAALAVIAAMQSHWGDLA